MDGLMVAQATSWFPGLLGLESVSKPQMCLTPPNSEITCLQMVRTILSVKALHVRIELHLVLLCCMCFSPAGCEGPLSASSPALGELCQGQVASTPLGSCQGTTPCQGLSENDWSSGSPPGHVCYLLCASVSSVLKWRCRENERKPLEQVPGTT